MTIQLATSKCNVQWFCSPLYSHCNCTSLLKSLNWSTTSSGRLVCVRFSSCARLYSYIPSCRSCAATLWPFLLPYCNVWRRFTEAKEVVMHEQDKTTCWLIYEFNQFYIFSIFYAEYKVFSLSCLEICHQWKSLYLEYLYKDTCTLAKDHASYTGYIIMHCPTSREPWGLKGELFCTTIILYSHVFKDHPFIWPHEWS